jgi:nuclear pore complex protein Nup133
VLLGGGAVVAIKFVDVVVFCARGTSSFSYHFIITQRMIDIPFADSLYQDRITLTAPQTDQILGLAVLPPSQPPAHYFPEDVESAGPEEVLILTAGVLMRVRVDLGSIKAFNEA